MDLVLRLLTARLLTQGRRGEGARATGARVDIVLAGALSNRGKPFAGFQVRVADGTDRAVKVDLVGLRHFVVDLGIGRKRDGRLIVGIGDNIVVEDGTKPCRISAGIQVHIIHAFQPAAAESDLVGADQIVFGLTRSSPHGPALGIGYGLEGSCGLIIGSQGDVLVGLARGQGGIGGTDAVVVVHRVRALGHGHRDDAGTLQLVQVGHGAAGTGLCRQGASFTGGSQGGLVQVHLGGIPQIASHGVGIDGGPAIAVALQFHSMVHFVGRRVCLAASGGHAARHIGLGLVAYRGIHFRTAAVQDSSRQGIGRHIQGIAVGGAGRQGRSLPVAADTGPGIRGQVRIGSGRHRADIDVAPSAAVCLALQIAVPAAAQGHIPQAAGRIGAGRRHLRGQLAVQIGFVGAAGKVTANGDTFGCCIQGRRVGPGHRQGISLVNAFPQVHLYGGSLFGTGLVDSHTGADGRGIPYSFGLGIVIDRDGVAAAVLGFFALLAGRSRQFHAVRREGGSFCRRQGHRAAGFRRGHGGAAAHQGNPYGFGIGADPGLSLGR